MPRHRTWFPPLSAPMEADLPRQPSLLFTSFGLGSGVYGLLRTSASA